MSRTDPMAEPPFRDRSIRLVLFGSMAVAIGGVAWLLGLLHFVLWAVPLELAGSGLAPDPLRFLMGGITWLLLGTAFVVIGVGSLRRRRWVRPMMLTLAWSWLLGGAGALLFAIPLIAVTSAQLDPVLVPLIRLVVLVVLGLFGVLLPAVFIWIYRDRELLRTCEANDPHPSWIDACPSPVLGLAVALGACGVLFLPMALRPAVPMFGWLVTGWPGALLMLASAAACLYLARAIYRRTRAGWWGTTLFLVLLGASMLITQLTVDPAEMYAALGYPAADAPAGAPPQGGTLALVATAVITVASALYMVRIRKHFPSARR